MAFVFVLWLTNGASIYKQEVLDVQTIRFKESHVMARLLDFEAKLTNIFPRHGTRISRVVISFKHISSGL